MNSQRLKNTRHCQLAPRALLLVASARFGPQFACCSMGATAQLIEPGTVLVSHRSSAGLSKIPLSTGDLINNQHGARPVVQASEMRNPAAIESNNEN